METIGYRISKARRYLNMNQKELAIKAGITEGSLSRYENDIREPKAAALTTLAEVLSVSVDYLLGITDDMEVKSIDLSKKTDAEIEDLIEETQEEFKSRKIMFDGRPLSDEELEEVLRAMKLGMKLALEDQKNRRNR